jgi:putative SOS response-associated peptidase YedK
MSDYLPPGTREPPPTWIRVRCRNGYCGHSRAVPFAPWRIRWGSEDVGPLMRRHFKCGSCGRQGCDFDQPPRQHRGANGMYYWDPEFFPTVDALRISGQRLTGESYEARDRRVSAAYIARYPCGDAIRTVGCLCNLYSLNKGQKHIADSSRAVRDLTGNMPPYPAIFPNRIAPVVRTAPDGVRELINMRWGFPPPTIPGSKPRNPYLTNVRNTDSRYWQRYLKQPEQRCLVPVTSFAEPDNSQGPRSIWTWFARSEARDLMFFAGIWREFEGDRGTKAAPNVGNHLVFSFLTTDASPDVVAIHPDATPVLLLDEEARETWMNAPWEIAREMQKPPTAGALRIVATDTKEDAL